MLKLVSVKTDEQVEWLRVQRSRPELYKYFRQDKPISPQEQVRWWKGLDKTKACLFIIEDDGLPADAVRAEANYDAPGAVGYVGFNPLLRVAGRAEFGMFILPEYQGQGYGTQALLLLLKHGFEDLGLKTIYSDILEYPREDRFGFYKRLGFEAFPEEHQYLRYPKQGKSIASTKFFMTKDMWEKVYGEDGHVGLGPDKTQAHAKVAARASGNPGVHSGAARLHKTAR